MWFDISQTYSQNCSFSNLFNPLSPKIHIQMLQTDLHTLLLEQLRDFGLRSKHSPFGNQFSNSHNLYSWWSADVVGRKLMLVTLGTYRVNKLLSKGLEKECKCPLWWKGYNFSVWIFSKFLLICSGYEKTHALLF